jgi:hypothetical protein
MPALSRRQMAGAAAGLAMVPAAAKADPDARLRALCAEFIALQRQMSDMDQPFRDQDEDVPDDILEFQRDHLVPRVYEIRSAVAGLPAQTWLGCAAKARMVFADLGEYGVPADQPDRHAAWSLARDVMALG